MQQVQLCTQSNSAGSDIAMAESLIQRRSFLLDSPNEILIKILEGIYLSFEHERTASHFPSHANFVPQGRLGMLRLVSKRFHRFATPYHYHTIKIDYQFINAQMSPAKKETIAKVQAYSRHIHLEANNSNWEDFAHVLSRCANLHSLT